MEESKGKVLIKWIESIMLAILYLTKFQFLSRSYNVFYQFYLFLLIMSISSLNFKNQINFTFN